MNIPHPAWIEIDTAQFRKNLAEIRLMIGDRHFCLPVKANAYGHGLCPIGKIAEDAGVNSLGVARLKEALLLRESGLQIPIILFGPAHEDQIDAALRLSIEPTISSKYKAELFAKKCKKKLKVHLEIDTGMRRTGVREENALDLLSYVDQLDCFDVVGIYSHLATADTPNDPFALKQIDAFRKIAEAVANRGIRCHLANSGGVAFYPASHFDMVRPGLLAYGYLPNAMEHPQIKPILSLKAKVSYFKVVEPDTGISYGHEYHTRSRSRIATIPIGYGDGYRRAFSQASVLIRSKLYPIAGTICMDQFMVDLGSAGEAYVGDEVTLIGQIPEEISLWSLAKKINSTPYELLCSFNERLPRFYF